MSDCQKIARKRVHDIMRPCKGEGLYYRMQLKQKREDRFSYCRGQMFFRLAIPLQTSANLGGSVKANVISACGVDRHQSDHVVPICAFCLAGDQCRICAFVYDVH